MMKNKTGNNIIQLMQIETKFAQDMKEKVERYCRVMLIGKKKPVRVIICKKDFAKLHSQALKRVQDREDDQKLTSAIIKHNEIVIEAHEV